KAVGGLEGAEQAPPLGQHDVAITESREILGGKAESHRKGRDLPAHKKGHHPQGDLHEVRSRRDQRNDRHDGGAPPESPIAGTAAYDSPSHTHGKLHRCAVSVKTAEKQEARDEKGKIIRGNSA